jgi:uncharacterized protein (TIGR02569 family)
MAQPHAQRAVDEWPTSHLGHIWPKNASGPIVRAMPSESLAMPPSNDVLASFDASDHPVLLVGGRGRTWRAGDIILKPADLSPDEHAWQADLLPTIRTDGFRLPLPRRTGDGSLVVAGWAAWERVEGDHHPGRWLDIIEVGVRFHRAIASVPRPDFLDARTDPWSIGDRVAWGEAPIEPFRRIPSVDRLADILRPIEAHGQVIHGDLTGNVLFADKLPPAIIDLSPYWRPAMFASAIVVADALVWEGADKTLVARFDHLDSFGQYLARALIFRLVSAAIGGFEGSDADLEIAYGSAVAIALERAMPG